MDVTAPCPLCDRTLVIVEAVPTPPPARTRIYRAMGSRSEPDVKGVCVHCDLLVEGVREYVADTAAERRVLEDATGRAAAARVLFHQGDAFGAMRDLARAFPPLRHLKDGLDPWDPEAFDAWVARGDASAAELDAAAFVLHVWNADEPWSRPFDAMASLARWDRTNRAVFVEWATSPWWP